MLTDALAQLLMVHDLPEPPPADPLPVLAEWMHDAQRRSGLADPWAMTLATATPTGVPSARIVLCKELRMPAGALVFFTNADSRKGTELRQNPRAACVFHWPHARRQARVEGSVAPLTDAQSDTYFASRPLLSRIGAAVSRQSSPIASREQLIASAIALAKHAAMGHAIPRPASWGGFQLLATTIELWSAREGRLHQRVAWRRDHANAPWQWTHLAP